MDPIIFDDGSTITFGNNGEVVSVTSAAGDPVSYPGPQGSGIVQQFSDLFNYGIRAAIDSRFRPTAAASSAGAPAVQGVSRQSMTLLIVAALGVAAVLLLKKG